MRKKIMYVILGLVVIIGIAYYGPRYMNFGSTTSDLTTDATGGSVVEGSAELARLSRIENMSFDVGFFDSKSFRELQDNSVVLTPGDMGKPDIFSSSAASVSKAPVSTTTKTTTTPARKPATER